MPNARLIPLNWLDAATLTPSSQIAGMEAANLQLTLRSKWWRTTASGAQTLDGTWGGDGRKIDALGVFRHNLHGGTIRLQLYSDATWTTQIHDTGAISVPATALGSFDWGVDPLGTTSSDPLLYESPFLLWLTSTYTAASFRVSLAGTPASGAAYWQIGRLWLGKYWELGANPAPGMAHGITQEATRRRARSGSLRTSTAAARWLTMDLDWRLVSDADAVTWHDFDRLVGLERDVVVSLFPGAGGRLERDNIINGKLAAMYPLARGLGVHTKRLTLEEL